MSNPNNFENESTISEPTPAPSGVFQPATKTLKSTPTKNAPSMVKVKLANTTIYEGRYLVYRLDDISQVFLVPKEHLTFAVSEQLIDLDILNASDKPYDWNAEINAVFPTIHEVRLAVYRNGLIKQEDALDRQLSQMALYGAFPNRFKGE